MILNSVQSLCSWPFEKIGVFVDNTITPEASARMGIRFRNSHWDVGTDLLNWNPSLNFVQSALEPDVLNSQTLSGFYDSFQTKKFTQPTNFVSIPDDFPIFYTTSATPFNNILLNFKGGLSAISIYPSQPYPVITKLDGSSFTVSAVLLPLTAFDGNVLKESYYAGVLASPPVFTSLGNSNCTSLFRNSYYSSHKKNYLWKKVTSNALYNTVFNNDIIPTTLPYDNNIIPDSFKVSFALSGTGFPYAYNYTLSYANTINTTNFLSGLTIEIQPYIPIGNFAISTNLNAVNARLNTTLGTGYIIPRNSNVTVSYETSSVTNTVNVVGTNDFYTVSAQSAPYLYNHQFDISSMVFPQRKAFTISYSPSAFFIPTGTTSAFDLSTVFIDNFYQTYYPVLENKNIAQIQFIESTGDVTLSAIDKTANKVYKGTQWIPASATLRFINSGIANFHTINLQLSTCKNAIYNLDPMSFILNKNKALLTLNLTNSTDFSANVTANIFPNYDPNLNVLWDIYPPENVIIKEIITNRTIHTGVPDIAGLLNNNLLNLGVDNTTISLYSSEFDISASTTWFPSSAVYNNVSLVVSGVLDDFPEFKNFSLSALFLKNNLLYPVPQNGSIIWNELNHDPKGFLEFDDVNHNIIYDNSLYPSTRNFSNITPTISTDLVSSNPQQIVFNITCNTIGDFYNLNANKLFFAREYPANYNIYAILSCSDGRIINTSQTHGTFFTSAVTITGIAYTNQFSTLTSSNIIWKTPLGFVHGLSTTFPLNSSFCIGLTAISAQPINGGFGFYDFANNICLDVFDQPPINFDYIAFPEYKFFPTQKLSTLDNSYLNSNGLTGLSALQNQNFIISAIGGFSLYFYKIGNKLTSSNKNTITMNISLSDVMNNSVVSVTGYNEIFVPQDPLTVYNTASSNNFNIFREHLRFVDFPQVSALISTDNNSFDIRRPYTTFFDTTLTLAPSTINVISNHYNYILSSVEGIKVSEDFDVVNNNLITSQFSLNPSDFFSIKENSYNVFNYFVTGNLIKNIPEFPIYTVNQSITSNILSISAYDGPDLEIFTLTNINPSNTLISFVNETDNSFPNHYNKFIFNDGANHIQTVTSYNTPLTGIYSSQGIYSPSLTGIVTNGTTATNIWNNFIIIKDNYDLYNTNLTRQFPQNLTFPYTCQDMVVPPNTWQYSTSLNDSINKINTNYEYLNNMTSAFDITVPKYFIGWIGEKNGKLQWHYDDNFDGQPTYSNKISTIKDILFVEDKLFMINGINIEIRDIDFNLTSVYSSNKITDAEVFQNPIRLAYNNILEKLIVIDSAQYAVFIFDIINNQLSLTHYWGGLGDKSDRTKLNNPTDITTDNNGILYIVDADSQVVKCYNPYLNWIFNIDHVEWNDLNKPLSITIDNEGYKYILSTTGIIYKFDIDNKFIIRFNTVIGNRIYNNLDNKGTLYILNDDVYAYTLDGIFLNKLVTPQNIIPNAIGFYKKEIYIANKSIIYKVIDFINIQKIKNYVYSLSAWNISSILVSPDEPITTFVFNDSFKKLNDNLTLLNKDIVKKFVITEDEFGSFISHSISAINTNEKLLSSSSYIPIGLNELVTYETINRSIHNLCYDSNLVKNTLETRTFTITSNDMCWTWKNLKITQPQTLNSNRRPYSWYELTSQVAVVTGITWENARNCCGGNQNHFPLCWTWNALGCACLLPLKWNEIQCGDFYGKTWNQLQNDKCCEHTNTFFDDCIETC